MSPNPSAPEASIAAVLSGNLSGLSEPLLIAAASYEQYDQFVWREGLVCTEARRFREPSSRHSPYRDDKILLILPGYENDAKTAVAVARWIEEHRHYVFLSEPYLMRRKLEQLMTVIIIFVIMSILVAYLLI